MRTLSSAFLNAIMSNSTDEVFVLLITISHPDLSPPIRIACNQDEPVVSNGWTFFNLPVEADLPDDEQDAPPVASLRIMNVNQEVVRSARSIRTPPEVQLDVVLLSDPDNIEITLPTFNMAKVEYNILELTGELQVDDLASEPYPAHTFTPAKFRGIF
jgi:hypothetical protein